VTDQPARPEGELLLRTSPMPSETNAVGEIFGGWIMSQMDIAGAMLAMEVTRGRIVTVAVEAMRFFKPVKTGDIVCCYGKVLKVGTTSITVRVEVWVQPGFRETRLEKNREQSLVTEAAFTYVAVDQDGRKRPIPKADEP